MQLKLLQLNIFQGRFLDRVIDFARQNDVDILHLQEVTTGRMSLGGGYRYPKGIEAGKLAINSTTVGIDCFETLKKELNMDGELVITNSYVGEPESGTGNATLFKKHLKLVDKQVIWMKGFFEIEPDFTDIPVLSRAAIITQFAIKSKQITTINAHLTWGPTAEDAPYKIEQAEILYEALKKIPEPFIFTGDFNVTPDTQTASMFNSLARNLTTENQLTNTLNPNMHPAKHLFPPGLAVDYIFVSENINVASFKLIDDMDLSDHLGLLLEFEL